MAVVVVFDTNVLISALLIVNGNPFRCLALDKMGVIESVTCESVLQEFADKLLSKFKFSWEMTQKALAEVRGFSQCVEISGILQSVMADPNDDMVIEYALVGNATAIITGNKHLLALCHYQGIQILIASEFITPYLLT